MSSWLKFVAFGCCHEYWMRSSAREHLIRVVEEQQPDVVVNLGDLIDVDAKVLGGFGDRRGEIDKEFKAADALLRKVDEAAPPGARLVSLDGNHEWRLTSNSKCPKELHGLMNLSERIPALRRWERIPYKLDRKHTFRLGQVTFHHGCSCAMTGDRDEAVLLGVPWGLHVRAHTHRPVDVTRAMLTSKVPLERWFVNTGTLSQLDPEYADKSNTSMWGGGPVVGVANTGISTRQSPQWKAKLMVEGWADSELHPDVEYRG